MARANVSMKQTVSLRTLFRPPLSSVGEKLVFRLIK